MTALEKLQKLDRTTEISGWNIRVYFWSRSAKVLSLFTFGALALSLGLAWVFADKSSAGSFAPLAEELARSRPDFDAVLTKMHEGRSRSLFGGVLAPIKQWVRKSQLAQSDQEVALAYWESLAAFLPQPSAELLFHAHCAKPLRRANQLVGDFHAADQQWEEALRYYEREQRIEPAPSTRAKILAVHLERRELEEVRRLARDADFAAALTPSTQLTIAAVEGRWTGMLAAAIGVERGALQREALLLGVVAGAVWFLIAWQMIQPKDAPCFRTVVPLLAVVAGALSTIPTLAVGTWQEEVFGLREGGGFYGNLEFFVAGVGPREEVIKLLFFLPFLPLLLRRRNELEVLVVAACVGLGFAAMENLLYFAEAGAVAAYGRFLTANFLHMATTGLIGLAFYKMLLQPLRGTALFLVTLALVTLAHGIYDAFLVVRSVRLFAIISISTFMALSFAFFQQLRTRRHELTDQFSIAGTLVLGLALLTGLMLFCAARQLGLVIALVSLATNVVMLWIFASMFHWQLGEGMSAATHAAPEQPRF